VTQSGGAPNANDSHAGHYATLRDAELILAMRRYEQEAFVEFIERHRILVWNHARDLGVAAPERRSWSEEVLHDCALALVREGARIPANLPGYIIVPYSTIAEWLGETRSAVAQRIWRLTKRVSEAAEQIIAPFSSADQEAVRRFLHVRKEDRNETS
jgi:hypothetical protein